MLQSRAEQKKIHKQQTYYRTCLNRNGKNMYSVYLIKVRTSNLLSTKLQFLGMFSPLPTCHWLSGWVFQPMMNSDTPPCESRYRPLGQLFLHCSLEPQICLCLFPLRLGVCQGYVSMIKDFLTHDFLDHLWQKRAWKGRKKVRCLACIFMFFSVFRSLGQFLCCKYWRYWRYQNIISSSTYSPPFILWSNYFPLIYLGDVIHKNHRSPPNISSLNSPRCWCIQKIVYQLPHNKDPKCHLHHSHDIQASTRQKQ